MANSVAGSVKVELLTVVHIANVIPRFVICDTLLLPSEMFNAASQSSRLVEHLPVPMYSWVT